MSKDKKPKWQKEVEAILSERFKGVELKQWLKAVDELIDLAQKVEIPSGDAGEAVALLLNRAGIELTGLAAVYSGFMLGVAYERYQREIQGR